MKKYIFITVDEFLSNGGILEDGRWLHDELTTNEFLPYYIPIGKFYNKNQIEYNVNSNQTVVIFHHEILPIDNKNIYVEVECKPIYE